MHIVTVAVGASVVTRFGNPLPFGCVTTVESRFIKQFLVGVRELRLLAFFKEFLCSSTDQRKACCHTRGFRSCAWWQVKHNRANDGSGSRLQSRDERRGFLCEVARSNSSSANRAEIFLFSNAKRNVISLLRESVSKWTCFLTQHRKLYD
jgi:hypothetical protein